jgi:hypothetical protein
MKNFYTRIAGMMVDARRPQVPVKGFWLRPAAPGGDAIIHVFSDEDARTPDGRIPTGGGAVHHLSFLTKQVFLFAVRTFAKSVCGKSLCTIPTESL